jgi:hypothetical protein
MSHHHEALIKHRAELHHEALIHREKLQHELKTHFFTHKESLTHSSLHKDSLHKDSLDYKELNALFGHRSTAFYHEQALIAARYRKTHDNALPSTPFWEYIELRRAINPVRFDHYHPIIGQWVRDIPSSIPEPGSGILLGLGIIIISIIKRIK